MKLNKRARTKKRLMTTAEMRQVIKSMGVLFEAGLISNKRANLIARNFSR